MVSQSVFNANFSFPSVWYSGSHSDSSQPGNRKGSKESVPLMTEHEESSFAFRRIAHKLCGMVMTINFILFWAVPIAGMGGIWKFGLKHVLLPIYDLVDSSSLLRGFAEAHIYTRSQHADFAATSLLLLLNSGISLGTVFYWQVQHGSVPAWLVALYYCSWVGVGGRIMGAAYALAHKEGHNFALYKKPLRGVFGNFFENWLGMFYGIIPYSFTTSHVSIHHRLDGGLGDTFYQWDLNRASLSDFCLYVSRILQHMTGYSSAVFYAANDNKEHYRKITLGMKSYSIFLCVLLAITRSPNFVFWIVLQPLLCMTYFLALLNFGFHGFIEFDENGNQIQCVNATTIIEGEDDYFGEDDHMAHHYNSTVYYRDLAAHQKSKEVEFAKYKASVFKKLSIVELSILVLLGQFDVLAEHYVDYSGKMSKAEISAMLRRRAMTTEVTYEKYLNYLKNPTAEERQKLRA